MNKSNSMMISIIQARQESTVAMKLFRSIDIAVNTRIQRSLSLTLVS
jgi:hypothetical protein